VAITYKQAGVDISAADALIERIKPLAASTRRPEVLADVGGFAGMCRLPAGMKKPVLVSGTDGVGTKLKVAIDAGKHDTVGIDLVAMCVNDILTCGADPLFFLDYFATGKLVADRDQGILAGIAEGCRQAGCALLGGETAELPGLYADGDYDLAGFAVGVVEEDEVLDGRAAETGDALVGVASNGLHSNGYSLARKVLLSGGTNLRDVVPELGTTLAEELLRPTRIYAAAMKAARAAGGVRSAAHVTGGGLTGNVARALPKHLAAELHFGTWKVPPIFDLISRRGPVDPDEMRATFNLGLGLVIVVAAESGLPVVRVLRKAGEDAALVGRVVQADGGARVRFLG